MSGSLFKVGAGGIGMSGLAKLLLKNKAIVAGSDQTQSGVTDKLCQMGADIRIGHKAEQLRADTDAVVISAAIKEDNTELKLAQKLAQITRRCNNKKEVILQVAHLQRVRIIGV